MDCGYAAPAEPARQACQATFGERAPDAEGTNRPDRRGDGEPEARDESSPGDGPARYLPIARSALRQRSTHSSGG